MLNRVTIMGRLTANPELRQTQGGVSVLSFTVAVDRRFSNPNGERKADFISCVAWRQTAEFISKYFVKAQQIAVDGSLRSRTYVDKNGNNRSVVEVVVDSVSFCGNRVAHTSGQGAASGNYASAGSAGNNVDFSSESVDDIEGFEELETDDSELPF